MRDINMKINKCFKKNEKGILTIEASIVLVFTIFFFLFIYDFGYIFRSQNYITQVMVETGEGVSFLTYKYKTEKSENVLELVKSVISLFGYETDNTIIRTQIRNEDYSSAVKQYMISCVTSPEKLKSYGVDSSKMDFSKTQKEANGTDLRILVEYQVELPFKVFGYENITLHQQILVGLWQ